jgi:hypothetical protein
MSKPLLLTAILALAAVALAAPPEEKAAAPVKDGERRLTGTDVQLLSLAMPEFKRMRLLRRHVDAGAGFPPMGEAASYSVTLTDRGPLTDVRFDYIEPNIEGGGLKVIIDRRTMKVEHVVHER